MNETGVHRRRNLLTGDWVLVSPHRLSRPWQGAVAASMPPSVHSHDPDCFLCPGNARSAGERNPDYAGPFVFDNDFPALLETSEAVNTDPLLVSAAETGQCRVICYSPDHGRSMSAMSSAEIEHIVNIWASQTAELASRPDIGAVTVFENRGEMMGASNPHPHGQIWATHSVPNELAREAMHQAAWLRANEQSLLSQYLERELAEGARVVCANADFVVLVPFWAAWPFETLLLPRHPVSSLPGLTSQERKTLAACLSDITRIYDAVFETAFPYTMGWHQMPSKSEDDGSFTLHAHFYPPLLRSASVRKFMVGFEMLGTPQRDLTAEVAAERLRTAGQRLGIVATS
ncbi:MAG: UDP-glucose--hexose-1-phosphate uridylyltransferase [Alphaproteobacteria bacterium]